MCVRTVAIATMLCLTSISFAPETYAAAGKRPSVDKKTKGKRSDAAADEPPLEAPSTVPAAPPGGGPPALSTKYKAAAVLPIEATDVGDELVRSIEQALLNEIDEKSGFRAVSPRDVLSDASTYQLETRCGGEDAPCQAKLARYARAHLAVVTRVAAFGGVVNVSLRLVDAQSATELGRVADSLSEKADERLAQLHRLTVQLFTPADYVGTLLIKSDEAGADVYLNDKLVGTTPLKRPLKGLAAGPYILHVTKEGFADVYQFVDVTYNRTATITVSLATNTIAGNIAIDSETGFGQIFVISSAPDVEIRIDGEPKGVTPLGGAIHQVAAGKRRLSLRRGSGPPLIREIPVEAGRRTDIGVTLDADGNMTAIVVVSSASSPLPSDPALSSPGDVSAIAVTSTPPSASQHGVVFTTGLVTAGLGAAALIVGGVFANSVRVANNDAEAYENTIKTSDNAAEREEARQRLIQLNEDGPTKERNQWIALGVGAGLVTIGGVMMAADHWHWFGIGENTAAPHPREQGLRFGLAPAFGGGMVSLGGVW